MERKSYIKREINTDGFIWEEFSHFRVELWSKPKINVFVTLFNIWSG